MASGEVVEHRISSMRRFRQAGIVSLVWGAKDGQQLGTLRDTGKNIRRILFRVPVHPSDGAVRRKERVQERMYHCATTANTLLVHHGLKICRNQVLNRGFRSGIHDQEEHAASKLSHDLPNNGGNLTKGVVAPSHAKR